MGAVAMAGSVRFIPLPELAESSDAIMTGRIIHVEKTELREGVIDVLCHIRVDSVLKGMPLTREIATKGKAIPAVAIQYQTGAGVPSPKLDYKLGEEGVWFLHQRKAKASPYHGVRRDLSNAAKVKKLLRDD